MFSKEEIHHIAEELAEEERVRRILVKEEWGTECREDGC